MAELREILALAASVGLMSRDDDPLVDESGWDFLVVHTVDSEGMPWIVRYPRRPALARRIGVESAVLELVRASLPVAVPDWRIRHERLVAYPRLPGEPAAVEDPWTLRYQWRLDPGTAEGSYIDQVGRSLSALHSVPVPAVRARGVRYEDPAAARALVAEQLLRAHREVGVPDLWRELWHRWLEDDECWSWRPVVLHGDVHPGHTLVDGGGRLSGLLDWTNTQVGDPALDFVDMAYAGGRVVMDRLLAAYGRHGGPLAEVRRRHVLARTSFVWVTVGLNGVARGRPWYRSVARRGMTMPPDDELLAAFPSRTVRRRMDNPGASTIDQTSM